MSYIKNVHLQFEFIIKDYRMNVRSNMIYEVRIIIYYKKNDFPDTAIINPNTGKNPESNKIINLNNFAELNKQLSSHFKIIGVTITNYC